MVNLKKLIQKADELIKEIEALNHWISESTRGVIEGKVKRWFCLSRQLIEPQSGESNPYVQEFIEKDTSHIFGANFKDEQLGKMQSGKSILESIILAEEMEMPMLIETEMEKEIKAIPNSISGSKPRKVFISHKKEDKAFADALVDLIEFIVGSNSDRIFCSSIPGYGVRQSKSILEELKTQFDQNEIYMIIIHSPRYYQSAVCLNEMGASWALGTKFSSFMTKDCSYDDLKGVIGKESICININDDDDMLKGHLNDFKDDLLDFFGLSDNKQTKWENARSRFIRTVSSIQYDAPAICI